MAQNVKITRTTLPKPRKILRVGVVGHVELPASTESWLKSVLLDVLQELKRIGSECFESPTARRLYQGSAEFRFISNRAPGTDQIADAAADALGYETYSILPVPTDAEDTPNDPNERLHLQSPARETNEHERRHRQLELPHLSKSLQERLDDRYALASRILVDHVDLIIAVWNGPNAEFSSEQGGKSTTLTATAILHARSRNVPVVWINPRSTEIEQLPPRFRGAIVGATNWPHVDSEERSRLRLEYLDELKDVVRSFIDPYHMVAAGGCTVPQRSVGFVGICKSLFHQLRGVTRADVQSEATKSERPNHEATLEAASNEYRAALESTDEQQPKPRRGVRRLIVDCWLRASPFDFAMRRAEDLRRNVFDVARHEQLSGTGTAAEARTNAETCAHESMSRYRAAFSAIFFLGPIAVLLGVLAYQLKMADDRFLNSMGLALTTIELVIIAAIVALYLATRACGWQERALTMRVIAEAMRQTAGVQLAWLALPRPRVDGHQRDPHEPIGWPQWYVQSVLREHVFGLSKHSPVLRITAESLRTARDSIRDRLILNQADWYRRKRLDHYVMLERSHAWQLRFFIVVAIGCLAPLMGHLLLNHESQWFHDLPRITVVLAATLPALASACHGMAVQGELRRIEKNYRRVDATLRNRAKALTELGDDFTLGDLQREVAMASGAMLAEVDDWHRSYGDHPPPLT